MGLGVVLLTVSLLTLTSCFEFHHHDNDQMVAVLGSVHSRCPNITRVYTLSERSVRGRPLYVIEFTMTPGFHEIGKPEFKYIANMHGNEVLGRELLLKLADHLCEKYLAKDPEITKLISMTRIHLMPSMNPDGWQLATDAGKRDYLTGRTNNNSVDLNRNFPDLDRIMFSNEESRADSNNHLLDQVDRLSEPIQPETRAVMRLIMAVPFVLSANMHGGDLVANYPYDLARSDNSYHSDTDQQEYAKSPDDDTFRHLALVYATNHATMSSAKRDGCGYDGYNFGKQGGITNGAAWYSVEGGMQDFNYLSSNDFEITLELGCDKYPKTKELKTEWEHNKKALINFIWQVHTGVKGVVSDAVTGKGLSHAVISVANLTNGEATPIKHDVTSVHDGDYWRLLTPGRYEITASRRGYRPMTKVQEVKEVPHQEAQRVDFHLQPLHQEKTRRANNLRKRWMSNGGLFKRSVE